MTGMVLFIPWLSWWHDCFLSRSSS